MAKPTFTELLDALAALRDPVRLRLYRYVEQQPRAVGRDEAASAAGITRAAAAFHLDRLVELGLLRPEFRRLSGRSGRGAGRPSKLYRRSRREFALSLPPRNHELLARLLAQQALTSRGDVASDGAAHRSGHSLGVRARKRISARASSGRLDRCVADILESVGFEPFSSDAGELRARNCPFDPLSRQYESVVCSTAIEFVRGVVEGVDGSRLNVVREMRADSCCVVVRARPPAEPGIEEHAS